MMLANAVDLGDLFLCPHHNHHLGHNFRRSDHSSIKNVSACMGAYLCYIFSLKRTDLKLIWYGET